MNPLRPKSVSDSMLFRSDQAISLIRLLLRPANVIPVVIQVEIQVTRFMFVSYSLNECTALGQAPVSANQVLSSYQSAQTTSTRWSTRWSTGGQLSPGYQKQLLGNSLQNFSKSKCESNDLDHSIPFDIIILTGQTEPGGVEIASTILSQLHQRY